VKDADEVAERYVDVSNRAFDLLKLGQMSRVERLIAEHFVYGEELGRLEWLLNANVGSKWSS
jgi:hypothetical protein